MCGICGFVSAHDLQPEDQAILRRMTLQLAHRGPDDEGYFLDKHVHLGMRRLSIIDLATGHQPISNEEQSLWLIFNGEIYNYREIRSRLEKYGHAFKTKSDTEVIIHAYEQYGKKCVEYLNGMFAFALWDQSRQSLFIARDHLGIKPLYYWHHQGLFVFGSELKAILTHPEVPRDVDPAALDQYLTLEYIPGTRTIYQSIAKLSPGHWLEYRNGAVRVEQYWDIQSNPITVDENTCSEMLTDLLQDAVRMQLVSDVPLGAFLSGGIDSSTIVSFMQDGSGNPPKTFSIGFDDGSYNELAYARAVAAHFKTDHHEEFIQPDIAGMVEDLVEHMGEPFADFSIFPTFLVSRLARQSVKVVLSGDGGDELFAGYDTYLAQQYDQYFRRLPAPFRSRFLPSLMNRIPPQPSKKGLVNKTKRMVEGSLISPELQHTRWMMFLSDQEKVGLYRPEFAASLNGNSAGAQLYSYFQISQRFGPLAQQQFVDVKTYLVDDILMKVDRMSMANSLEARVPLLDYRLVEFALNLPEKMKLHRGQTKVILRKVMKNRLPQAVLNKPKQGFSIPIKNWLRGPLKPLMMDMLDPMAIQQRGYFNPEMVQQWMKEHLEGRVNHSHRLWSLIVFELWYRQSMKESLVVQ